MGVVSMKGYTQSVPTLAVPVAPPSAASEGSPAPPPPRRVGVPLRRPEEPCLEEMCLLGSW
jgi:hypothetical protein